MSPQAQNESFQEFKDSFAYGSRTDLNFKFLRNLTDEEAALFLQELLWKLGDAFDDGDFKRLVTHVQEGQIKAYAGEGYWTYDEGPFTSLRAPLSICRLALLTSSGHFVKGNDPEPFGVMNMTQEQAIVRISEFLQATPQLSAIPVDTPQEQLRVRHGGYDVRGAQADANVAFPYQRLVELARAGVIGELAPEAYSFVGACSQVRLTEHVAPQWVERIQAQNIEAVLLVPV